MSPPSTQKKPLDQMTKFEMEEAIKKYRFVLMKLHKEIEDKDLEIARLNSLLDRALKAKA